MNLILTGPTGFIGSTVLRLALARGHRVAALGYPGESPRPGTFPHEHLTWIEGTLDHAPWDQFEAFQPEACVHTAWIATPGLYLESPLNPVLVASSLDFLNRAAVAGARHWLVLGSCIEYQLGPAPLDEETTPLAPLSTYARCKNDLRLALEARAAQAGLALAWGRVFYPYGVGEHPDRLCSTLVRQLRAGKPVELKTPQSVKDYIHIDDLAEALLLLVERRVAGPVNLGTGVGVTVLHLAETLAGLVGRPDLVRTAAVPVPDPYAYVVANPRRLRSLGWQPRVTLADGLRRLVAAQAA